MNDEFRKVMRELVKSNYSTLDSRKLKTIIDHFYGEGEKTRYQGVYKYNNGYLIHYPGAEDAKPYNPNIHITDFYGNWSLRFEYHNLPDFIMYIIVKWKRITREDLKISTYNLTGSSIVNYPTVEETVSHFLIWAKDTHRFYSDNATDDQFAGFLNVLRASSTLGIVYTNAVINWNGGVEKAIEYKQIPSSQLFYHILRLTISRNEYDDEETIEKWRRAIY